MGDRSWQVVTLADRPDLRRQWRTLDSCWPAFVHHAPTGLFLPPEGYEQFTLVAVTDREEVVARASSVPLRMHRTGGGGGQPTPPPDDGLDEVLRWAADDRLTGGAPDVVASVEVTVDPRMRGKGLGAAMLAALRDNARERGFDTLLAPVRPVGKAAEPDTPLADYVARQRGDGLPADPWLRAHVRLGGRVVGLAPYSMVVPGTLAQWRQWTGVAFDRSGPVVVPEALVPVLADAAHDYAVYVEPNVWVRHDLRSAPLPQS